MSLFPQHANPELDAELEADVKFFMKHGAYKKKFANNFAKGSGKGINILFLSIRKSNFFKISLNDIISGPIHSTIFEFILLSII